MVRNKDSNIKKWAISLFFVVFFLLLIMVLMHLSVRVYGKFYLKEPYQQKRCLNKYRQKQHHPLILISMDGFRHDYIELTKAKGRKLPNFDKLIQTGTRALNDKNAFVTITFPNHHTLVTGLYVESHGIVLNTVYDPKYPNQTFSMGNQSSLNDPLYFQGWPEPIWVTIQKQGGLTGSLLWPLTDAPINNELPFQQVSEYDLLDGDPAEYPYKKRVDDVIWWLNSPRYKLDFVMLYFPEPDDTGHLYGPLSNQIADKVVELDGWLGYLLQRLNDTGLTADIILTADHGMTTISTDYVIALNDYIDETSYWYTLLTPIGNIYPQPGKENYVYNGLKNKHPNMTVYWRHEIPVEFHYNNTDRVAPIVLVADLPFSITAVRPNHNFTAGNHGYNNSLSDMHPIFIANGPSFMKNYTHYDQIESVDVYPLICHILNFIPNPNNGSLKRITPILNKSLKRHIGMYNHYEYFMCEYHNILYLILMTIAFISLVIFMCHSVRANNNRRLPRDEYNFNKQGLQKPPSYASIVSTTNYDDFDAEDELFIKKKPCNVLYDD